MTLPTYKVYYNADRGLLAVEGTQTVWPARSLQVTPNVLGIMICMIDFDLCVLGPLQYSQIVDVNGNTFPDYNTTVAYLNEQFNQKPVDSHLYSFTGSAVWTVFHNLNRFPSVTTVDSSGDQIVGDVSYPDANTLVIGFSSPVSGQAYLN